MLLDRRDDNEKYQDLQRMLYLEAWDLFAPASYKGAQPVCYYCRQAGHVKRDCPSLQALTCFSCGGKGHTKSRCRNPDRSSFEEDVAQYMLLSQKTADTRISTTDDKTKEIQPLTVDQVDPEVNITTKKAEEKMGSDDKVDQLKEYEDDNFSYSMYVADEDEYITDAEEYTNTED